MGRDTTGLEKEIRPHVVYQYRRLDNNSIFYVGCGVFGRHLDKKRSRSNEFRDIVNKIKCKVEIILYSNIREEALEYEQIRIQQLIKEGYKTLFNQNDKFNICDYRVLVNKRDGGKLGVGWTPNEKQREKMSDNNKGENNWMYGKTQTMNNIKGNQATVHIKMNGVENIFECRKDALKYIRDNYGYLSEGQYKIIVKSKKPYNPRKIQLKPLSGIEIWVEDRNCKKKGKDINI